MRILTLDVGGTSIKSALFDNGNKLQLMETPSDGKLGRDHILNNIRSCISKYDAFDAIGISSTGQIDSDKGIVIGSCENIPNYCDTDLKGIFENIYHVPVFVENDVNAAAIGEAYYGSCMDEKDFLCLTYGTGVGGAIVINREVYKGSLGIAGEVGHIPTHPDGELCNCGIKGCYERYASTTALVKMVQKIDPSLTNGRAIFQAAEKNAEINGVIDNWIHEIVLGLVILTHTFNPSLIVLGGGIMNQTQLIPKIQSLLHANIMPRFRNVTLRPAKLGNEAGIYGMLAIVTKKVI